MILLEEKPGKFRAEVSEDGATLDIVRTVSRGEMPKSTALLMEEVWIASVLEELEGGALHERWIRHTQG